MVVESEISLQNPLKEVKAKKINKPNEHKKRVINGKFQVGNFLFTFGKNISPLVNRNEDFKNKNFSAMKEFLSLEGFLHLKNVFPEDICKDARRLVMDYLVEINAILPKDPMKGDINLKEKKISKEGYTVQITSGKETAERKNFDQEKWKEIGESPQITKIFQGEILKELLDNIFNGGRKDTSNKRNVKLLPDQSWLRVKGKNDATQEHADYYYFKNESAFSLFSKKRNDEKENDPAMENVCSRGADCKVEGEGSEIRKCALCRKSTHLNCLRDELKSSLKKSHFANEGEFHCYNCSASEFDAYTVWICLGENLTHRNSILGICPKSHKLKKFDVPTFKKQVPGDFDQSLPWQIPESIGFGDVIIFNIKTVHAASVNLSKKFRLSLDTRFVVE